MVRDAVLRGDLCVAIGICWAKGTFLGDGYHVGEAGGIAVDGCGGGEDDVVDVVAGHGAQEAESAVDISVPVVQRAFAGFANCLRGEK